MRNVLGVINLVNERPILKELTHHRCLASIPFGGRYRMIDFTMSNFMNVSVSKVAIFTKDKYRSLMDHLGSGKEWDLDHRSQGLFILPSIHPDEKIRGDLQQFYDHLEFFQRATADTVIIAPGHHICKIDFNDVIKEHESSEADITVLYKDYDGLSVKRPIYHQISLDTNGEVRDVNFYTSPKKGDHICLETYVIKKQLLIDLIMNCIEYDEYDFLKDIVKANLINLKVQGYQFTGYMPFIHSLETYHASNMEFLNPEILRNYFYDSWEVFTKIKHEAPAEFTNYSKVSNSLIANGCIIEGTVENSIIFRGVKVKKGAVVKNSIIMQKGDIEEGAHVENVITDKQVTITRDQIITARNKPMVIKKEGVV
ncbi:glucose-1-phosphate adenylyltransferase subunit GlgD [Psychrobacillus sp. INOP01]|uniref:glucose-1-phosphate adenylyltransferase subunit GlgD n=1 Tax=Psychrobacillus sp. INOP01 TaxID=2829187 RepID=UPI001BAA6680|nr:glucose-1-phosphate adenylyltransferase subunit GlgD [Psychrobacillus sp. INOP01]QUG41190.1 glucose-1-phosphate adenylyltransferase subunit GlgD [Psychrobacillus sp. INOP01]